MKRANNLFPKLVSEENLRLAIFAVNVTHRFHPHHRPNRTVARVEADVDRYVKELREIITGGYEANEPRLARRWDKSAGKWRDISEPRLWPDQYVHHAVIQVLEPIMMRGMDNFTLFGRNKRKLRRLRELIEKWLAAHGLRLNGKWQLYPTAKRTVAALGYRFGRGYTMLRKRNMVRLKHSLSACRRAMRRHHAIKPALAQGLLSRLGQMKHCNHVHFFQSYVEAGLQRKLKCVVREHARKERARWNTSTEQALSAA